MSLNNLKNDISNILSTFFGIGLFPFMPGTIGTLSIALIWFLIPDYYFYNKIEKVIFYDNFLFLSLGLIVFGIISVFICTESEKKLGHDASSIVIDEVVGYLFAVLFLPKTTMIAIYAFILFRFLDISKPLFINKLQNLPKGLGIMADDVAAGIVANIILQIMFLIKPQFFI